MLKLLALLFLGLIILLPPSVFSSVRPLSIIGDKQVFLLEENKPIEYLRLDFLGLANQKIEVVDIQNSALSPLDPQAQMFDVELKASAASKSFSLDSRGEASLILKLIRGPFEPALASELVNGVITLKLKQNDAYFLLPIVVGYQL
jgi:hypothetical protein